MKLDGINSSINFGTKVVLKSQTLKTVADKAKGEILNKHLEILSKNGINDTFILGEKINQRGYRYVYAYRYEKIKDGFYKSLETETFLKGSEPDSEEFFPNLISLYNRTKRLPHYLTKEERL